MYVLKFNDKAVRFISGSYISEATFTPYSHQLRNSKMDKALKFDTWEEANHVLSQINAHKFHEDISIVEIGEIKDSI